MAAAGPSPRILDDTELVGLLEQQQFGVLATVKRTGHPHLSTVLYHWSAEERLIRVSTTLDRLKVRHLNNNPSAALHVQGPNVWSFAVVEGAGEVSEATRTPGDAIGEELLSLTPGFADPAQETAFLEQAVREQRVLIRLPAARLYGTALDVPGD